MKMMKILILIIVVLSLMSLSLSNRISFKPSISLRSISLSSLSLSLSLLLCTPSYAVEETPAPGTCTTASNPTATIQFCRQLGLDNDGRLRGCLANENCFSTSSKSATKYLSPWEYGFTKLPQDTPSLTTLEDVVWEKLRTAVRDNDLKILKDITDDGKRYMLAAEKGADVPNQPGGSSLFYEFTLKNEDKLVLYRAVVDKTVFIYPLQEPVSDFGALRSKLDKIRDAANFLQVGASSISDDALLFSQ